MSHTPGPWQINTAGIGAHGGKVEVTEIYVYNPDIVDDVAIAADIIDPVTCKPSEANARLIAAAPDLLAELKKTVDNEQQAVFEDWLLRTRPSGCFELVQSQFHESSDFADFRESWKSQIAAIAKATGQ